MKKRCTVLPLIYSKLVSNLAPNYHFHDLVVGIDNLNEEDLDLKVTTTKMSQESELYLQLPYCSNARINKVPKFPKSGIH